MTKKTGTKIRTWMVEMIMPPTIGAAIGFITSEPTPDSHKMGIRLARTAATVINFGRRRCTAPSIAASLLRVRRRRDYDTPDLVQVIPKNPARTASGPVLNG